MYTETRKVVLMNLFSGKEWRHKHREQLVDTMEEGEGRTNRESSIDTYTVSRVKYEAVTYNTGSPAWYSATTQKGEIGQGTQKGGDKCMIMTDSCCHMAETREAL